MKKLLLFVSALTGFAYAAQAEGPTTVKTTTVQYQVPTCTNCRTTTEVRTVYPEAQPACTNCGVVTAQPAYMEASPVLRKDSQKEIAVPCSNNHELGIRNPIFTLKQGQFMARQTGGVFKEPKHTIGYKDGVRMKQAENRGGSLHSRLSYGLTDRWSISVWGGKEYATPKKKSFSENEWFRYGYHSHTYDVDVATEYHLLDFCNFDLFVGVGGEWHRNKVKRVRKGKHVERVSGLDWGPTAKAGLTLGWFTPYVYATYTWDHTHTKNYSSVKEGEEVEKSWRRSHGYYVNPGLYFQPSKWVGFDFGYQKRERSAFKPQWNFRTDFYPYKNVSFSLQLNARQPYKNPMQMYGAAADFGIVF